LVTTAILPNPLRPDPSINTKGYCAATFGTAQLNQRLCALPPIGKRSGPLRTVVVIIALASDASLGVPSSSSNRVDLFVLYILPDNFTAILRFIVYGFLYSLPE
jgi:hypothetical protein